MGRFRYIRFPLDFMVAVTAISKFPMISNHFRHDAGAADKGHHNNAHVLRIDFRATVEFLLSFNGQLFGGFRQIYDFGTRILNAAQIGIGLQ